MINPALITLAAALPKNPEVGETMPYVLTGVLVVIGTLSIMAIVIQLLGVMFVALAKRAEETKADTPLIVASPAGQHVGPHAGHEPEIVAAIAAAVDTVITQPHRILSIRGTTGLKLHGWSAEGRRHHHHSRASR